MTTAVIITICVLLLLAYIFDISSSKTKIPSVILLLILGFVVQQLFWFFNIHIPDLTSLLPVFGTLGLILIVLEGSLELEFNKSKFSLIKKAFIASLFPMLGLAFLLAFLFQYFGFASFKDSLTNAIPLCVISSAIAIPSVRALSAFNKEFIIYESSLSDIIGVVFFNFVALNENFGIESFGVFSFQIIVVIIVSFIATILLAFLLNRIRHHVRFAPIILLVVLIYSISKVYHFPGLIFIMILGIFLGNLDELKKIKWTQNLNTSKLNKEVHVFKDLIAEGTFLVKSFFFLLFGYSIKISEILNANTAIWAAGIVIGIFVLRAIQLKILKISLSPLLFIAPRGLITVLLFISIVPSQSISLVNKSLIIQVVILTALLMMIGLLTNKSKRETVVEKHPS